MNKYIYLPALLLCLCICIILPVSGATLNGVTVTANCVLFNGTSDGAESAWFTYGHSSNTGFSSSTANKSANGAFSVAKCDDPTFMPSMTYKVEACGFISGCSAVQTFTMPSLIPEPTTTFGDTGYAFIENGGDPDWVLHHMWDVYTAVWGSYFVLLLIALIFMNITIKQRSVAVSLLLAMISGGALWTIAPPELQQIGALLIVLALSGMMFWVYKRRR